MTTATPIQTAAKKSNTNLTIMTDGHSDPDHRCPGLFRYIYNLVAGLFEASALAAYENPRNRLRAA